MIADSPGFAQSGRMSATAALIFLAEAVATCAPGGTSRLRAGANVVDAIVTVAPESLDTLKPTIAAASDPTDIEDSGSSEAQEPDDLQPDDQQLAEDQPAQQCEALPLPIA